MNEKSRRNIAAKCPEGIRMIGLGADGPYVPFNVFGENGRMISFQEDKIKEGTYLIGGFNFSGAPNGESEPLPTRIHINSNYNQEALDIVQEWVEAWLVNEVSLSDMEKLLFANSMRPDR